MLDSIEHMGPLISFLMAGTLSAIVLGGQFWQRSSGLRRWSHNGVFLAVAGLVATGAALSLLHNKTNESLGWLFASEARDFGVSEYGIVLALAGIAAYAGVLALRRAGAARAIYAAISLACVFVAGEELSWGQWIFHWSTPETLAAVNLQNETNLHNLVDPRIYDLVYAAIGWATLAIAVFAMAVINRPARAGDFILVYLLRRGADWLRTGQVALLLTLGAAVLLQHELFEEYAEFVFGCAAYLFMRHLYLTDDRDAAWRPAHA